MIPMPRSSAPPGHGEHYYFFMVLAPNAPTGLPPGLTLWEFLRHLETLVIGMNRLVGTCQRG
jgi:phosphatidylethanolamine-binding protein (PEBP) family uncharacterized protein